VRGLVVHQDARYIRNRECPKGLNNVPCVIWSCIKMHATYETVSARKGEITFPEWFGRASRCTLRTKLWIPEGLKNVLCMAWSCIKMHATYEIVNARKS